MAAGAVVSPGRTVPSGEVWAGAPAKRLRALEPEEAGFLAQAASDYAALAAVHAAENSKTLEEILVRGSPSELVLRLGLCEAAALATKHPCGTAHQEPGF